MAQPEAPRSSAFDAVIEALYRVFARYAPRGVVMGCPHCLSEEEMARLTATPLRAHTGESLGHYTFKAMTTWGVESDFKYFLPRILELFPFQEFGAVSAELLAKKILHAGWKAWPEEERIAVQAYVEAVWDLLLTREVGSLLLQAENVLGWAVRLVDDVGPLLSTWERTSTPSADVHLARMVEAFGYKPELAPKELGSHGATVARWLFRAQIQQRLENAFFANPSGPYSDELSSSADILNWKNGES
jgi:hypothetical protein